MVDVGAAARVDGRSARAERTRAAIVEALLELNREGDLKPTGERIAERAGVSLRALWANFKDMEALFAAASARLLERQDAEHRPISADLPLDRAGRRVLPATGPDARDHRAVGPGRRN